MSNQRGIGGGTQMPLLRYYEYILIYSIYWIYIYIYWIYIYILDIYIYILDIYIYIGYIYIYWIYIYILDIYIYWIYIYIQYIIYIGYLDHPQYCVMPNIWGIWELFQMAPDCWDSRLPRIAISSTAGSFLFSCLRLRVFFRLGRRLMLQILGHRACPGWVLKSSMFKKYRWIKVLKYS